jgi:hypothetical protein
VKDSFYVVSIGIEDECGVVRGVIVRPQTRPSVVDPSCLLFLDPEVSTIVRREAGSLRALDNPDTEGLQRTLVERATLCDVAHAQRHVIKQGGAYLAPVEYPAAGEGSLSWASTGATRWSARARSSRSASGNSSERPRVNWAKFA